MRRTNPRSVPGPLSAWVSLASSLLLSSCFASDHVAVSRRPSSSRLSPREEKFEYPNEHVVLADCTQGDERHLTSQMAYYYNAPDDKPVDVALVDTQPGQFALWINSNTTAIFTDTNIYFTATLGPIVKDGEYAGYGQNGADGKLIHNFNCWRKYQFNLYEWQNARCSMTYYCNHDKRPDNAPDIVVTASLVPSSTATTAPGESVAVPVGGGNGTLLGTQDTAATGLSHGALIGTIVGSVAVLVIGGLIGLWLFLRRRSRNKDKKDSDHPEGLAEADDGRGYGDRKSSDVNGRQELDAKLSRYEMDTEAHRFEMAINEVAELDGTGLVFDRKDSNDMDSNDIKLHYNIGGDIKHNYDTKISEDVKQREVGDRGDDKDVFDEPKTMLPDELKARTVDKAVIRASTGAGSATVSRWTEKKENERPQTEEQQSGDEIPLRAPPTRSQTNWSTWTTDSEVDLAGFPLVLMSPMSPVSPLSPSGPKPPDG